MSQRVFICYARTDQTFALPLAEHLKARGVAVWIDQLENQVSDDWDRDIDRALRECSHLLIVLSPASVDSREVRGELRTALDLGKPVLPVLYQACEIPRQLRVVQFVDFTKQSPSDEIPLTQLLRALQGSGHSVNPLGPPGPMAVPAPAAARIPAPSRRASLPAFSSRTKGVLAAALALLLVIGVWFGLDRATEDRRRTNDAALSPDGAYLATVSGQGIGVRGAVRVWDVASRRDVAFMPIEGPVWVCAWSPDGKTLAAGDHAGTIHLYDADGWRQSVALTGSVEMIEFIAWSPDGTAIATGDSKGTVWVWNVRDGKLRFTKPLHRANVVAISWAPDSTRFATASWDKSVAIVDAGNGTVVQRLLGHTSSVEVVAFSPDGKMLASGGLDRPHLILWDSDFKRHDLEGPGTVGRLAWSPDARYLATVGKENLVHVFDPTRYELVRRFAIAGANISGRSLAWSPDGTRLAAGDSKGVELFDPQKDVPVGLLPDPTDATFDNVELAGWSSDGSRLGTFVSFENTARVWDVARGAPLQTFSVGVWRALTE